MFDAIDKFLLDQVFEPLSDWMHSTFGLGVYTFARLVLFAAATFLFLRFGIYGLSLIIKRPIVVLDSAILLVVISYLSVRAAEYEERYHRRLSDKLPPDMRSQGPTYFRQVTLIGFFVTLTPSANQSMPVYAVSVGIAGCIMAGTYLLACRPRPPRAKRVKKLKALPA